MTTVVLTKEQKNLLRDAIYDRYFIQGICDYAEFEEEGMTYTPPQIDEVDATPEDILHATIAAELEFVAGVVYSHIVGDYEEYAAECAEEAEYNDDDCDCDEDDDCDCDEDDDEDDDNSPDFTHFAENNIWETIKYVIFYQKFDDIDIDIAIDNCLSEAVDLGFEDPFATLLEALENFYREV